MNKKMRELKEQIKTLTAQAKAFMADGENKDVNKANELMTKAEELQKEYEAEKRLFELDKDENAPTIKEIEDKEAEKNAKGAEKKDSVKEFAEMARNGFKPKTMTEGTMADGGYTVPEDIRTNIERYREAKFSLLNLVKVEKVNTNKGARTFKKRSQQTGFTKVGEGGKITKTSQPSFERLEYEIDKYAGYFPVTNELLADSDANITQTLEEWIGDESRVTANNLILTELKKGTTQALTKTAVLDDIKKVLNVTLGSAFKATSSIVTNDNGLQYLDTLKDADGNYLLQPNPADPMKLQLTAGANVIPVHVIPNADLPNDATTKIPFIIGDLKEGCVYWDRQLLSIMTSNTASIATINAFEEDLTIFRAIEREDVTLRDSEAFVYCTLETAGE